MRNQSWSVALSLALSAGALFATGCSSATTGDDAAIVTLDDGATATTPDASTEASTTEDAGDGQVCPGISGVGTAECDTCVSAHCCTEINACDDGAPEDGGLTACETAFVCVLDDVNPPADAGVAGESQAAAETTCSAPSTTTALVNCAATSCATECNLAASTDTDAGNGAD